jgi:DNA (cytosine-5)-methyltransferase 1
LPSVHIPAVASVKIDTIRYYTSMACDSGASAYEFFAGGGFARLGLAPHFRVTFANDIDPAKVRCYRAAFPGEAVCEGDVWDLSPGDLPDRAALAWASFPCQDLSLAGARHGLSAPRSGAFWGFWRLIEGLIQEGRAPDLLALENVAGLLTSRSGADFAQVCQTLAAAGYHVGAVEADAAWFAPQSRPRVFIIACRRPPNTKVVSAGPVAPFHGRAMKAAVATLCGAARARWVWWRLPPPPLRNITLSDILEDQPSVCWNSPEKTAKLLDLMSQSQRQRVETLLSQPHRSIGAAFKRMRVESGYKVQRAEARFDGLAGCLRTPAGGSSRQSLLVIEDGRVRSRLIGAREAARLMGVPDDYPLPESQNAALHLLGDGVAVPVVQWLTENLLQPLLRQDARRDAA